jgi:hypothetical protein
MLQAGNPKIEALGVNVEGELQSNAEAVQVIADAFVPQCEPEPKLQAQRKGAAVRLFFSDDGGLYTYVFEPRFQDVASRSIFLSCNYQRQVDELPDEPAIQDMYQRAYHGLSTFAARLRTNDAGA